MNILRYKQQARNWVYREDGGGDSSSDSAGFGPPASAMNYNTPSDASAYGGRYSGFDPNTPGIDSQFKGNLGSNGVIENTAPYTPGTETFNTAPAADPAAIAAAPIDQFAKLKELSDMFNKQNPMFAQTSAQLPSVTGSLNQLVNSGPIGSEYSNPVVAGQDQNVSDNYNTYGTTTPNTWQKLGLVPGMTSENFFNRETPMQRDERMGMVSDGIGRAVTGALIPAPIRLGLGAYGAYKGYQADPNKDIGKAIATGAQSLPGYAGALANMYNGNYGAALTGGLAKNGVTGPMANLAGIGADFASGKNVAPSLGGLAGQFAGQSIGGPLGGMFGKSLGQFMGKSGSIRK
jgi:hypothetical protein